MMQSLLDHKASVLVQEDTLDGREHKLFFEKSDYDHFKLEKEEEIRTGYQSLNEIKVICSKAKERF